MFTQPILVYIKEKYPTCKITFATGYSNMSLFDCWPTGIIDNVIPLPFKTELLKTNDYHLTFEGAIESCREAEELNCYDIFRNVSGFSFDINDYKPILIPNEKDIDLVRSIVPENTILIQMRASASIRTMSSEKWAIIIRKLKDSGFNVGVIDSPKTHEIYESIKEKEKLDYLINFTNNSDCLSKGIAILSLCKGFIGIDSSFTHLAPALGIPTVGLYGPFLGELRMKYYDKSKWIDPVWNNECGLYPCFFHQM
jgi:ADP-heptose:LPS heptosyltransferase